MRKPRGLTQLESNLAQTDTRLFETQPKAVANPSSIFKAPKRAKKAKASSFEEILANDPASRELAMDYPLLGQLMRFNAEQSGERASSPKEREPSFTIYDMERWKEREVREAYPDYKNLQIKQRDLTKEYYNKVKKAKSLEEANQLYKSYNLKAKGMLTKVLKTIPYSTKGKNWLEFRNFFEYVPTLNRFSFGKSESFPIQRIVEYRDNRPSGDGAPVGAGMDQKEELMAERNGQFVGLAVGRPGVRPKKATGGRALVPVDQLPSTIGGSMNRQDYSMMI